MKVFRDTTMRTFDNITDPKIRAKIEANFGGKPGGLKAAMEEASRAVNAGELSFSQATASIVTSLEEAGAAAKADDEAISGFGTTFQELSKQLNKSSQAETKITRVKS